MDVKSLAVTVIQSSRRDFPPRFPRTAAARAREPRRDYLYDGVNRKERIVEAKLVTGCEKMTILLLISQDMSSSAAAIIVPRERWGEIYGGDD